MLILKNDHYEIRSDRRLLKASDVAAVRTAAQLLADAQAEADRIRASAAAALEAEKQRGYDQGLSEGKLEIAAQKLDQVDASVAFMESVESKMASVVMKALRSCVEEIGDEEMIHHIVRKTLKAVIRTQKHVTLKVPADLVPSVRSRVDALLAQYPTVETFDVVEDPRLTGASCLLETEAGVADAAADTQLAAIEKSLRRHFSKA